jgi:hypothetical protein
MAGISSETIGIGAIKSEWGAMSNTLIHFYRSKTAAAAAVNPAPVPWLLQIAISANIPELAMLNCVAVGRNST